MKKLSSILIALTLSACAGAAIDPNAIQTTDRIIDKKTVQTAPPAPVPVNVGVAAGAAMNVALNDTLRRPIFDYTIKTENGQTITSRSRVAVELNDCVKVWIASSPSYPRIVAGGECKKS
jgi:hypothetical protein